jgi:hypothetical protein
VVRAAVSRSFVPVVVAVAAAAVLPGATSGTVAKERGSSDVTRWIDVELDEIAAHRTNPPRAARALALVSVAMLEATDVPRAHQRASVAGAATTVLSYLFPDRAEQFDALTRGERPSKALARGRVIGSRIVARARTDGSDAVFTGTVSSGPGLWVPTHPASCRHSSARRHVEDVEHLVRLRAPTRPADALRHGGVRSRASRGLRRLPIPDR